MVLFYNIQYQSINTFFHAENQFLHIIICYSDMTWI